jgi:hypothetical protein
MESILTDCEILKSFSSGNLLALNKQLITVFGLETTAVLSSMIDRFLLLESQQRLIRGKWFFYTNEDQQQNLGLNINRIRRAKQFLKENEILETKMMGVPAKEYFYIEPLKILKFLKNNNSSPTEIERACPPKTNRACPTEIERAEYIISPKGDINIKRINSLPTQKEGRGSDKKLKNDCSLISKKLAEIIRLKKNIEHTPSQIASWNKTINLMITKNKINPSRIMKTLEWYEENWDGDYIPVIESASSLREKFIRLENAMNRKTPQKNKTGFRNKTNQFKNTKYERSKI